MTLYNNIAERSVRGSCVGKKNYLFFGSDSGGARAAIAYSLIETCRLNHIDPHRYLQYVLERIADHPINRVAELLRNRVVLDAWRTHRGRAILCVGARGLGRRRLALFADARSSQLEAATIDFVGHGSLVNRLADGRVQSLQQIREGFALASHEAGQKRLIANGDGRAFDRGHPPDADVAARLI